MELMQRTLYGKDTSLSVAVSAGSGTCPACPVEQSRRQFSATRSATLFGVSSPFCSACPRKRSLCSYVSGLPAIASPRGHTVRQDGASAQRYTNHVVGLERRIGSTMQLHPRTRFGKWCHSVSPCMCGAVCVSLRSWPCDALETTDVICFHLHNAPSCTI